MSFASSLGTADSLDIPNRDRNGERLVWVGYDTQGRPMSFVGAEVKVGEVKESDADEGASSVATSATLGFIYAVAVGHRRRGYGRETLTAVLSELDGLNVERLSCHVDVKNQASLTLLRSLDGFAEAPAPSNKIAFVYRP